MWAGLLEAVMDDPDFEWLMIDASYIKAHPHSYRSPGRDLRPLPAQKGAEQQAVTPAYAGAGSGSGLSRNAGQAGGDRRHGGRLLLGVAPD